MPTLSGNKVRLIPMLPSHGSALAEIGLDPSIWLHSSGPVTTASEMQAYVDKAINERDRGVSFPFVTTIAESGEVVGTTRFGNVNLANLRMEIGWTWIAPAWQRTFVNTEAKLLMLTHGFEDLGCRRIELKTDVTNRRSRNAILRLGAREEGILRKHMVRADGSVRHTIYFSVTDDEWPGVKKGLIKKLGYEPGKSASL